MHTKVILLQSVKGLGTTGDAVNVRGGFARNYLIPRQLAVPASLGSARAIEHQNRIIEVRKAKELKAAEAECERLGNASVSLERLAGEGDKLFGSVTARDIADALQADSFRIDHTQVVLPEPIKQLGVYQVPVKLHANVEAKVKVWVIAKA